MSSGYRALLIGNSAFPADPNLKELTGPVNDVTALKTALGHQDAGLFDPADVRLVTEQPAQVLRIELERFFSDAKRDDTLLLFYSGHGVLSQRNQLFLCAQDTQLDLLKATAVGAAEISLMFEESVARTTVIVLDCCYSGAFKGGNVADSLRGTGRFLLTSCRGSELAGDATDHGRLSLFTHYLVEGIVEGAADGDGDGYADLSDLYDYVYGRLAAAGKQRPQRNFSGGGDVPIARRSADRTAPIPAVVTTASPDRPHLELSTTTIDLGTVYPGETLEPEQVFVFNEGDGTLDWEATTADEWLAVDAHESFFTLTFTPRPGPNRGQVSVRERQLGLTKVVRVSARLVDRDDQPARTRSRRPRWLVPAAAVAFVILVLAAVATLGGGGSGGGPSVTEVTVGGSAPWVATGVQVTAGDSLRVEASGTIVHDVARGRTAGPDGDDSPDIQEFNVVPDFPHGGLIGRLGPNGGPFAIGSDATDTDADRTGELFLQVNDVGLDGNGGEFAVTITLDRP